MIIEKEKFFNGIQDCLVIYSDTFKIKEVSKNVLWNATENSPITIVESRRSDYIESGEALEIEDEQEILEIKNEVEVSENGQV